MTAWPAQALWLLAAASCAVVGSALRGAASAKGGNGPAPYAMQVPDSVTFGRGEFTVSHWLYSAAELRRELLDAGFQKVGLFGGLDGSPYDHNARRLVALARRSQGRTERAGQEPC